jgi:hypothetical protein
MPVSIFRRLCALAVLLSMLQMPGASRADDLKWRSPVVPLTLVGAFSDAHRAKILRAVNEWNVALNGSLRFELLSDANRPAIWAVIAVTHSPYRNGPEALGLTTPFPAGGGLVLLYLDRLGGRDLGAVMRHELGHVLGLKHDVSGRLMSAAYNPHDQKCVDYPALARVAELHNLVLRQLKWCGETATP